MPRTRRRRGGSRYDPGDVLQKDCDSHLSECPLTGCSDKEKVVLDYRLDNDDRLNDGWTGHLYGTRDFEKYHPSYQRIIKDKEIACWKKFDEVATGGKRRRRRKTSKKGGSKRRRTRRRR